MADDGAPRDLSGPWPGPDTPAQRGWVDALPRAVRVYEVGPRDGLQNIDHFVPTEVKIALIDALAPLGFDRIEAVSFVHPRVVPQVADAEAVMAGIQRGSARIVGLVPNVQGVERALAAGVDEMNFVLSASESQNRSNLNQSIAESQAQLEDALRSAASAGVPMRLTISTSFGCPFEGYVPPERVLEIARRGADAGAAEICLGDTTGMANPAQVYRMFLALADALPGALLAVHLHDTRGAGSANLLAAVQAGVTRFDASMGGLGGCPFAPGATGNIGTEDSVHMLEAMGIDTGVDLDGLIDVARRFEPRIGVRLPGQVLRAGSLLSRGDAEAPDAS